MLLLMMMSKTCLPVFIIMKENIPLGVTHSGVISFHTHFRPLLEDHCGCLNHHFSCALRSIQ